eukprot:7390438-Prymnesium_polylepis.1
MEICVLNEGARLKAYFFRGFRDSRTEPFCFQNRDPPAAHSSGPQQAGSGSSAAARGRGDLAHCG